MGKTDGFNARVLLNTLLNVTVLSILLSIIGTWVGTKQISLEPLKNFLHIWLRNLGITFWIELLRFEVKALQARQDRKTETVNT